jgi:hypothetical protein
MWTDVQLKTQVVQVMALKEFIDKLLDPMKWPLCDARRGNIHCNKNFEKSNLCNDKYLESTGITYIVDPRVGLQGKSFQTAMTVFSSNIALTNRFASDR